MKALHLFLLLKKYSKKKESSNLKLIDEKQLSFFLKKHGVKHGDNIFIHGNAIVIAQTVGENKSQKISCFWNSLKNYIGPKGTIIVPTFTYSPMKSEIFESNETKSDIGQFSEQFRLLNWTKRTNHPIFSVSYWGSLNNKISEAKLNTCFGEESIFELLYKENFRIFCIGCSINEITFIHYLEEKLNVDYRYHKNFNAEYISNGKLKKLKISYFVRDLKYYTDTKLNLNKLKKCLKSKKKLETFSSFLCPVYSVLAKDLYSISSKLYKDDPLFLIES